MKRALRIALHPVVIVLLAIDVIGIALLLASPSWGYRAVITYGSLCPLVEYCYGSQGGLSFFTSRNTNQRGGDGLFIQEMTSFDVSCEDIEKYDNSLSFGVEEWLRCAASCTGRCDAVEECAKKCPDNLLVQGFKENCLGKPGELRDNDPMRPFVQGDLSVGDFRGRLRLASYALACKEGSFDRQFGVSFME